MNSAVGRIRRRLLIFAVRQFVRVYIDALIRFLVLVFSGVLITALLAASFPGLPILILRVLLGAAVLIPVIFFVREIVSVTLKGPMTLEGLNRSLERKCPGIEDSVVNALSLHREYPKYVSNPVASAALERLLDETAEKLGAVPSSALSLRRVMKNILLAGILGTVFFAGFTANPRPFLRGGEALYNSLLRSPQYTLSVRPGDTSVASGDDLEVTALTNSPSPPRMEVRRLGEVREQGFSGSRSTFTTTITDIREETSYRVTVPGARSRWYTVTISRPPRVKELELTYHYPSYTGKEDYKTSEPAIEALKGTKVTVRAESTAEIRDARINAGGESIPMKVISTSAAEGTLKLSDQSSYGIILTGETGLEETDPPRYPVRVLRDRSPEVELITPVAELEVPPDARIPVEGIARDDVGLSEIYITYRVDVGGPERREPVRSPRDKPRLFEFSHLWDISGTGALPGSIITFRVGAEDTNTLYGPSTGYSAQIQLKVKGFREEHRDLLEEAGRLEEKILSMLEESYDTESALETGDFKKAASHAESLQEAADKLEESYSRLIERMERDPHLEPVTLEEFKGLHRSSDMIKTGTIPELEQAVEARDDAADEKAAELSSRLERMLSVSGEALKRENMSDILSSAADSMESARDISDLLRDPEAAPEEIMRRLDRLKALLDELRRSLAEAHGDLPDEFINLESIQQIDMDSARSLVDEIEEALREGDYDRASELIEEVIAALQSISETIHQAAGTAQDSRADSLYDRAGDISGELSRIIRGQEELIEDTESLIEGAEPLRREYEKKRMGSLKESYKFMKSTTGFFSREADSEFVRGHLDRAPELIREYLEDLPPGREREAVTAFLEELEKGVEESSYLGEEEEESSRGLALRQEELISDLETVMEGLDALGYRTAMIDPEIAGNLAAASIHMEKAAGFLREPAPSEALPEERRALSYLLQSDSGLESFMQALMDMPSGFELTPVSRRHGGEAGRRGERGTGERPVEIPAPGEALTGREFRQKILEALRRRHPERYRRLIEEYFRSLGE